MKILFIGAIPPPVTGQSIACELFKEKLLSDGHDVNVININKSSLKSGRFSLSRVIELCDVYKQILTKGKKVDVVYFTISESFLGNLKDILVYILLFNCLERVNIHLHGGAGLKSLFKSKYIKKLNSFFYKRMNGVIILGDYHRATFDNMGVDKKIKTVKNYAADFLFTDSKSVLEKYKTAKETGKVNVLYLSNLIKTKGYEDLFEAYESLSVHVRERVSITYAGLFQDESEKLIFLERIKPYRNVRYVGSLSGESKNQAFQKSHIFVLPTYYPYEGQPISILEAYASGNAVITTNHSGIPDIFDNEINGLSVECGNSGDIAEKLCTLIENLDMAGEVGMSNLKIAQSQFTETHHLKNMLDAVL